MTDFKEGQKFDQDKVRFDLIQYDCVEDVAKILTFGCKKYADNSWQRVPDAKNRYFAALIRHLTAWRNGEAIDSESGESHLSHASCNMMFLQWLEKNPQKE